ncbi:MAG: NADH-quinone oxidoreductase subunit NuoF [Anaerolineales bacterium]
MAEHILLREKDIPDIHKIDVYMQHDGYAGLKKAIAEYKPQEVTQLVKDSNLRGRGGAGFSTGMKWSFIPMDHPVKYVAVNADESEPGTFKDRQLMEYNVHQVIEGAMIAAYAIQATAVYIYLRGEFWDIAHAMDAAIEDARKQGFVGENICGSDWSCEMYTHLGAGAYICGEESAMLSSLQGLIGQPRVRPPFPAQVGGGLYYEPTVVNNVETLANVPWILRHGAEAYKAIGTEKSPGPKIFCVSGHVENPGNYEMPLGGTFRELIEIAGGMRNGKACKAILPSGASGPVVPATDAVLDAPLTYEGMQDVGTVLGSASVIIMDEDTDMVWAALKMAHFFHHESCGKCTPCREGTFWIDKVMQRVIKGNATLKDIDILADVAANMQGTTLCALGDFAANPILSTILHFRSEYEAYIAKATTPAETASAAD